MKMPENPVIGANVTVPRHVVIPLPRTPIRTTDAIHNRIFLKLYRMLAKGLDDVGLSISELIELLELKDPAILVERWWRGSKNPGSGPFSPGFAG